MNRIDRERIANERFYNRTIGVWQALGEAVAVAAVFALWVLVCAAA